MTKIVTRGDRILAFLADSTGGRFYVANSAKDLSATFAEIEQDLRTQYYVSFPPQESTPGYHSLRVEVHSPRKLAMIGYYYMRPSAVAAAKKAFITNRIGDFGFAIGIFAIYMTFGTFEYTNGRIWGCWTGRRRCWGRRGA